MISALSYHGTKFFLLDSKNSAILKPSECL